MILYDPKSRFIIPPYRTLRLALLVVVIMGLASIEVAAQDAKQQSGSSGTEHGTLGELGAKLANPLSDVWALFTEFDWNFKKGDVTDTLYFAFVTGLTIGYGDIVMKTPAGRLIALSIGFIGILFTGAMVAVLVYAVRESMAKSKYHK